MKSSARHREASGAEFNYCYNKVPYARTSVPLTPEIKIQTVYVCEKCHKRYKGDECPRCKEQE